jgi:hypothetical protein
VKTDVAEELLKSAERILAPRSKLLEAACKAVVDAGFAVSDCLIVHEPEINGANTDVLVVCGVRTFELKMVRKPREDQDPYRIDYQFQPRILAHEEILSPAILAAMNELDVPASV